MLQAITYKKTASKEQALSTILFVPGYLDSDHHHFDTVTTMILKELMDDVATGTTRVILTSE